MKKLLFATALVASVAAFADPINAISFEGYAPGTTFANGAAEKDETGTDKTPNGPYFFYDGEQDGSSVKGFGGENAAAPNGVTRPAVFADLTSTNYLDLSTEGGILWRSINNISQQEINGDTAYGLGGATNITDGIYLDTLVQFTPTEDNGPEETLTQDDKLAIWLQVDTTTGETNLMVRASYYNGSVEKTATSFVVTGKVVTAGTWYRLTVKAIDNIIDESGVYGEWYKIPAFAVYIDGVEMASTNAVMDSTLANTDGVLASGLKNSVIAGTVFPSLVTGSAGVASTLTAVGFKGSGALDDIVWTTEDPFASGGGADWVEDATQIAANTTAGTQYPSLAGSALESADAKQLTEWAQTNNVAFADALLAAGGTAEQQQAIVEAFLLNCAPVAATVATEKAAFKAYITFDGSGNPVVTTAEGKIYNGTLQLKGKANLTDATWTDVPNNTASSTYHFYMFELSL